MPRTSPMAEMLDYLRQESTQERFSELLAQYANKASLTEGDIVSLTGMASQEFQATYPGILVTTRAGSPSQRRFAINAIPILAAIGMLREQRHSSEHIIAFVTKHGGHLPMPTTPQSGTTTREQKNGGTMSIYDHITQNSTVEDIFWQFFIPRALYASLTLLYEQTPSPGMGLILPIQSADWKPAAALSQLKTPDQLQQLPRPLLVGWHGASGEFRAFLPQTNEPGFPPTFGLTPIADLLPDQDDARPRATYLVREPGAHAPDQQSMMPPAHGGGISPLHANPRRVAGRLLRYLQVAVAKHNLQADADDMGYDLPYYSETNCIALLNRAAELAVELGGPVDGSSRWGLGVILIPTNTEAPMRDRGVMILGNSRRSPYSAREGVPYDKRALSLTAYRTGCAITRIDDIAWEEREEAAVGGKVQSAIAVPLDGDDQEPQAVFYSSSALPNAYTPDDMLLLRMVGKIFAEIVMLYQQRERLKSRARSIIQRPEVTDSPLPQMGSDVRFMHEVEGLGAQLRADPHPLTFIGVDIVDATVGSNEAQGSFMLYGDQAQRNLTIEVGSRIENWMRTQYRVGTHYHAYCMSAERFYLLLDHVGLADAKAMAQELQKILNQGYRVDPLHPKGSTANPTYVQVSAASRLGVVECDKDLIEQINGNSGARIRSEVERRLMTCLDVAASVGGSAIYYWDKRTPVQVL